MKSMIKMMKTISELNSKWWYRLTKVFFTCFALFLIVISFIISLFLYGPYQPQTTEVIECDNGITIRPDDGPLAADKYYLDACTQLGDEKATSFNYFDGNPEIDWVKLFASITFGVFVILLLLEVLRRIFYYIVLGSFKPPKE